MARKTSGSSPHTHIPNLQHGHRQTILTRLQAFLPPRSPKTGNPTALYPKDAERHEDTSPLPSSRDVLIHGPKFFKVKLLTWNMHDSLPKGDLSELFGSVPEYSKPTVMPGIFPIFPSDSDHPYHLVVVAGQECPTPSGIPKGLTASFKILDKDRDKSKEFDKDHDKVLDPPSHSWDKDRKDDGEDADLDHPPSGWTSMVEDYLCHHGGASSRNASPVKADVGLSSPMIRRKSTRSSRKGPYQLLIKERLMGIYMAVYIHRDARSLVRGMSKSSVAAGLIGGRVGNKGGVGISVNIDGTTFLFLNAHLAAHEGKVNHRVANFMKIKTELSLDDFLSGDDPRKFAEDLTDRFDFTFLLGDLNFRLDITRLHADWLISRQEYAQAFEFDQLHNLMKEGKFFSGFHEAPIHFPPTFKYDVLRTLKLSKRSSSKVVNTDDHAGRLLDVEHDMDETEEETDDIERASQASSNATSTLSQPAVEAWLEDEPFTYTGQLPRDPDPTPGTSTPKSRVKWISLLSPSLSTPPDKASKVRGANPKILPPTPVAAVSSGPPSPLQSDSPKMPGTSRRRFIRPPPIVLLHRMEPNNEIQEAIGEEKGVYDSSSKKRVPSWCDRILWKTTVKPGPQLQELGELSPLVSRSRVGSFFPSRFRSPSSQTIKDSNTTTTALSEQRIKASSDPVTFASYQRQNGLGKQYRTSARRANTAFSPPPTAPLPSEHPHRRSTAFETATNPVSPDRPQSAAGSIWRFLPAFLSPSQHQDAAPPDRSPSSLPLHMKGDVVCLNYNTLDDRGMRRLEGRSDHRPVMGTYLVYA